MPSKKSNKADKTFSVKDAIKNAKVNITEETENGFFVEYNGVNDFIPGYKSPEDVETALADLKKKGKK